MNNELDMEKLNNTKVRKALPKAAKLNNHEWGRKAGVAGTHDCSYGCQQTMVNTCRC
jgi:hypothetical protein